MKIFDMECSSCGASYKVAESETMPSAPNFFECTVCSSAIACGDMLKTKVFRLIVPPEHATFFDPANRSSGKDGRTPLRA
jgi:hypothetical protein